MDFMKRKVDRRKIEALFLSSAAEICETRTLLSADGVCLPAAEAGAVVTSDSETTNSDEAVDVIVEEDGEFVPELMICTMTEPEFSGEVEAIENDVPCEDGKVLVADEVGDSSLMLDRFMSSEDGQPEVAVGDGQVIEGESVVKCDGEERVLFDGEDPVEATFEDFELSHTYLSSLATSEEFTDDLAFSCGVGNDEVILNDVIEEVVVKQEVSVEDGEITEEEFVSLQDGDVEEGDKVPVRYDFGMNLRGNTGGELPVEILSTTDVSPLNESTPSVMGPVAISTPAAAPVVSISVRVNQPVSMPLVLAPSLAIPVKNGGFSPLFVDEEELLVTNLAPPVSEIAPLVSEVEDTVSSGLESGFRDSNGSGSDSSDASVGELTPILEDEMAKEKSVDTPTAEEAPVETEEPVSSVVVPRQSIQIVSGANYGRSIDQFMSEFAMNGFAG